MKNRSLIEQLYLEAEGLQVLHVVLLELEELLPDSAAAAGSTAG